jgi:hypothetical protein
MTDEKESSMIDTDALLAAARLTPTENGTLIEIVKANTEALTKIRVELTTCNNADKVSAILADVEKAIQDLSMTSQKVEMALRNVMPQSSQQQQTLAGKDASDPAFGTASGWGYGQYPIGDPFNPHNPVPWPPDYVPPSDGNGSKEAKK